MNTDIVLRVRSARPIIHSITNYVTANDCANILLACGASPIMSDDPDEASDIASLASAVVLNLGTLSDRKLIAMQTAGKAANELCRPVVLDPVGAGSSRHRTSACKTLINSIRFSVIRGNVSEIRALSGELSPSGGVDAAEADLGDHDLESHIVLAKRFAVSTHAVAVLSGQTDIVTDGARVCLVHNGHKMMSTVTGTGCQLSSLIAAYIAAADGDTFEAASAAVAAMGLAGELAAKRLMPEDGSGTYRAYIIDAIYNMTPEALAKGARYEIRP